METTRKSWKDGRNLSGHHPASYRHNDSFHPDPRDIALARDVIAATIRDGGGTFDRGYVAVDIGDSFAVGGKYEGRDYPLSIGADNLAYYLHKYVVQSPRFIVPTFVGTWIHDGRVYFDTVTLHDGIKEAYRVGRERNQVSIYSGYLGESITL